MMMKPIDDHADPNVLKRIRQIRKLEDKHHALDHHWNGLALDARYSDHLFKHHIARLRAIYRHHVSPDINVEKNTALEDRARLHMSAVTRLYGTDGIRAQVSDEKITLRELGWSDDVVVPSQRSAVSSKVRTMMLKTRKSVGISRSMTHIDPQDDRLINESVQDLRPRKSLRKRCTDFEIMDEDVIVLGKYRFNDNEHHAYNEFVQILRRMDPYDVNSVIDDIMADLRESNTLDSYGGISL